MACTDYERHERLTECNHSGGPEVQVQLTDGCSGRLCQDCDRRLDIRHWPDVAERIAGPADGLDVLQMLRALGGRDGHG